MDKKLKLKILNYDTIFTSMCWPGQWKLFIDTEGKFHICEKVKSDLPIGDVDNGFDFSMIRKIYKQWADVIIKNRCWECNAWIFCDVCLAANKKEREIDIECETKKRWLEILKEYIKFKEDEDKKKEGGKKAVRGSVIDYLRQL